MFPKKSFIIWLIIFLTLATNFNFVYADNGDESWAGIDLTIEGVRNIIVGLACWFARIAWTLMVIFIILAGFRFMYARGNPKAFEDAQKNFLHMFIGILVIMGVYYIIATVANAVGVTDFSFIPLVC